MVSVDRSRRKWRLSLSWWTISWRGTSRAMEIMNVPPSPYPSLELFATTSPPAAAVWSKPDHVDTIHRQLHWQRPNRLVATRTRAKKETSRRMIVIQSYGKWLCQHEMPPNVSNLIHRPELSLSMSRGRTRLESVSNGSRLIAGGANDFPYRINVAAESILSLDLYPHER
jgi:hypothetical protein